MTTPTKSSRPWRFKTAVAAALFVVTWFLFLPAYRQHVAIREIEQAGGSVVYWSPVPDWFSDYDLRSWLRRCIPGGVYTVDLSGVKEIDRLTAHLGHIKKLRRLDLASSGVTDADLAILADNLGSLENLSLNSTAVTDDGLRHLNKLKNLEAVYLTNTRITDAGIAHLRNLPKLWHLHILRTSITDVGVTYLGKMSKLRHLNVSHTAITDNCLEHLAHLTALDWLSIHNTQITDEGVEKLQESLSPSQVNSQWDL